jgi:hypothetical protein
MCRRLWRRVSRHVPCPCRRVVRNHQEDDRDRGGSRIRLLAAPAATAARPLPHGRPRGGRAPVTTTADKQRRDPSRRPRAHRRAATATGQRRPRRRPRDHRLAPRTRRPRATGDVDHPAGPAHIRTRHPRTPQAPPLLLPAVHRRATQRVLAVRLHPLGPLPTAATSKS